jgi:hypothetical protein
MSLEQETDQDLSSVFPLSALRCSALAKFELMQPHSGGDLKTKGNGQTELDSQALQVRH